MNQTRTLLTFALLFVAYLLWMQWQHDYAAPPPVAAAASASVSPKPVATDGSVPLASAASAPATLPSTAPEPPETAPSAHTARHLVEIDTDLLHLVIDSEGASIVRADLKAYPESIGSKTPVRLFDDESSDYYVAQSGLVSASGAAPNHKATFASSADGYRLVDGQDSLNVDFTWQDPSGIKVVKRYTFTRGSYVVKLEQQLSNGSAKVWTGNAYRQLQRVTPPPPPKHMLGFSDPSRYSFFGAGWYSDKDKFQKLKFDKFGAEPLDATITGGWLAMLQHYFFAAWIPPAGEADRYNTAIVDGPGQPSYLVRATAPAFSVAPGASGSSQAQLYIGPKLPDVLEKVAPHLDLAVDYGMLTVLSAPLHWVLAKLHALVGNWGVAIILLLLIIKAIFFKLSEAQYRSMAKMKKLQPRVQALKERYPDDKAKQQQAMLELYKQEKANPAAGCLPTLIQIPVFFALYYMLMQSVELRQAPFVGWIHDLSAPDPYFVLPVLNGALMLATQFLTPMTGMDPTQAKIMKVMPVMMAVMFALFPAGLVLYYCTNGLISLLQQWIIIRRAEAADRKA
jgi:YidC/Oxa1 family membrane protein insertase